MIRRLLLLAALLALPLAGCNGGGGPALGSIQLTADELREGCVASTLNVLQDVVDRLAPAGSLPGLGALVGVAAESGCDLVLAPAGGTTHLLTCPTIDVRGAAATLVAELTYVAGGVPVADPADADRLLVDLVIEGEGFRAAGQLVLRQDPGLVIEGGLASEGFDGCAVEGTLDRVTALTLADPAPGAAFRAHFTSGNVDLGVSVPGGGSVTGTAALVGRAAVVALEVGGVYSAGEITLE